MVDASDTAPEGQFPVQRVPSTGDSRKIIWRQLGIVLDDLLLNEKLPAQDLGTGFRSLIFTASCSESEPAAALGRV
jgi:hypothetical protein